MSNPQGEGQKRSPKRTLERRLGGNLFTVGKAKSIVKATKRQESPVYVVLPSGLIHLITQSHISHPKYTIGKYIMKIVEISIVFVETILHLETLDFLINYPRSTVYQRQYGSRRPIYKITQKQLFITNHIGKT